MIFARKSDAALASLVKRLDEMVAKHSDKKLSAFVNLIGADGEKLQEAAKEFAADNKVANIPVVVPVEVGEWPRRLRHQPRRRSHGNAVHRPKGAGQSRLPRRQVRQEERCRRACRRAEAVGGVNR